MSIVVVTATVFWTPYIVLMISSLFSDLDMEKWFEKNVNYTFIFVWIGEPFYIYTVYIQ